LDRISERITSLHVTPCSKVGWQCCIFLEVDDQSDKRSFTGGGETPSMAVKDAIGKVVEETGVLRDLLASYTDK
jgi:hypothetical protein